MPGQYPQQTPVNGWQAFGRAASNIGEKVMDYGAQQQTAQDRMRALANQMAEKRAEALFAQRKWEEEKVAKQKDLDVEAEKEKFKRDQAAKEKEQQQKFYQSEYNKINGGRVNSPTGDAYGELTPEQKQKRSTEDMYLEGLRTDQIPATNYAKAMYDDNDPWKPKTWEEMQALLNYRAKMASRYQKPSAGVQSKEYSAREAEAEIPYLEKEINNLTSDINALHNNDFTRRIPERDAVGRYVIGPSGAIQYVTIQDEKEKRARIDGWSKIVASRKKELRELMAKVDAAGNKSGNKNDAAAVKEQIRKNQERIDAMLNKLESE